MYWVMKMKHHTVFILQNKFLKSMLIYYYYQIYYNLYCLQCFPRSRVLECHVKNYLTINHTKQVLLSEEGEHVNF